MHQLCRKQKSNKFSSLTGIGVSGVYPEFTIDNTDGASTVTLTSAGAGESLVNDGTGPSLATKSLVAGSNVSLVAAADSITINSTAAGGQVDSVVAGTGISVDNTDPVNPVVTNTAPDQTVTIASGTEISVTGTYPSFTVTNSSPASSVTLTSAGGTESLVTDGTGPTLAVKGITAGSNITLTPGANDITITAAGITDFTGEWFCFASTLGKTTVPFSSARYPVNNFTQSGSAWTWLGSNAYITYQTPSTTATYLVIAEINGSLEGGGSSPNIKSELQKSGVVEVASGYTEPGAEYWSSAPGSV